MIAAISATGNTLDAQVDSRFGRAQYFVLVELDNKSIVQVIDNSANMNSPSGVGISAAQLVADAGAQVVLTGNVGPKAFDVLSRCNCEIYTGASGSVMETLDNHAAGKLNRVEQPTHAGRGKGGGMGRGHGMN